ncbi:MAG: HPr family phosphocarrier protein [Bacilli bacterium]
MKNFKYIIKDPEGIHARPATTIVQATKKFTSKIQLKKDGDTVDAKRMFGIMSLGAKKGEEIEFIFDGEDEENACEKVKAIVEENL